MSGISVFRDANARAPTHIIDDRSAPDMLPGVFLLDADSSLANDNTQFALIVQ